MTSIDKASIGITIAVVAVALGFIATGGTEVTTDISSTVERSTEPIKVGEGAAEKLKEVSELGSQVIKDVAEKTKEVTKEAKELGQTAKELTTSKLPSRVVSIPAGTAVPGCETVDLCYDPPSLIIFKGGEVIWKNDDYNVHTVTSGNPIEGPDKLFDSGLIKADEIFSYRFNESGDYDYFCMIHPWAKGSVTVR